MSPAYLVARVASNGATLATQPHKDLGQALAAFHAMAAPFAGIVELRRQGGPCLYCKDMRGKLVTSFRVKA